MSFFRQLIEGFTRPVVASESLDAGPERTWRDEPSEQSERQVVAVGAAVAVADEPTELRGGY